MFKTATTTIVKKGGILSSPFKRNLMRIRSDMDLTQAEFGKKVNCSATEISSYETGKYLPTLTTCFEIASGLGITVAELVCERSDLKNITGRRKIHKMDFSSRIEYLQTKLKLSDEVLFRRANVSSGTINAIKSGKGVPCLSTLYDLADALRCTAADLLYGLETATETVPAKAKAKKETAPVAEVVPVQTETAPVEANKVEAEPVTAVSKIPELIRPFVESLTLHRLINDMTRAQLAAAVHIDESAVSSYESGTATPNLDELYSLAAALNCSAADLLSEPATSPFAKNLVLARTSRNMFQKDLAAAVNVSTETIRAYELAKSVPNVECLYKIGTALGCAAAALV